MRVHGRLQVQGYDVGVFLGSGGTGRVWAGRSRATGEAVALKAVPLQGGTDAAQALHEAELLATVAHPDMVRLRETVIASGVAVLVLDLAERGSLHTLLAHRGCLTAGEATAGLSHIAAALAHAHAAGIVHGDVTPSNVLFSARGAALLADLGAARIAGAPAPVHGTPGYLDPNVWAGALPTAASDVYAIASVTFRALTGALPAGVADRDEAVLSAAGVPEATMAIVVRGLSPDPVRRGTAADFAVDLRHSTRPFAIDFAAGRTGTIAQAPPPTRRVAVPGVLDVRPGRGRARIRQPRGAP